MDASAPHAAAELLRAARRVVVCTGAGMSAESGIPTFRDAQGLWSKFDPSELATPAAFARDPHKVWAWYRARRAALAACEPHDGHHVLAAWESGFESLEIVTQNVDGLHRRAGSTRVHELHGRLELVVCTNCHSERAGLEDLGPAPHCAVCGGWLRPGVVWFHEPLPEGPLRAAVAVVERCDVLLCIGTSNVVYPAAGLVEAAHGWGAAVIEINPEPTPLSYLARTCIRNGARTALAGIMEALGGGVR